MASLPVTVRVAWPLLIALAVPATAFGQQSTVENGAWGAVRLHVESSSPAVELRAFERWELRARGRRGSPIEVLHYHPLCTTPCDRAIDGRSGWYFFGGDGIDTSAYFRLDDRRGPVAVRVSAGSRSARSLGGVLIGLGAGAATAGAMLLPLAPFLTGDPGVAHSLRMSSGVLLAAGVSTMVTGLVVHLVNRTRVTFLPGGPRG